MKKSLSLALLAAALLAGCAGGPPSGRSAAGLAYELRGEAGPAVLLQSGLGDGRSAWAELRPLLGARRVFSYDRPGYGDSPAAPAGAPRDPFAVAEELHGLLRQAGVAPPYLLVGHSLGGLYQYAFARLYPDEVAGLLLVDATHPRHWERMRVEAPASAALLKGLRATVFDDAMRREFDEQAGCEARLTALPPLAGRGLPVRVLVRGRYEPLELGAFEALSHALERDWLALTGAARVEPVEGAGHYIQRDRPAALRAAIEALAAQR